jgi:hypothetical protein
MQKKVLKKSHENWHRRYGGKRWLGHQHDVIGLSWLRPASQGCQTENSNLGKFWRALEWKMLVHFTAIWYNLCLFFGVIYGRLVYIPVLVCLDQELSGNPGANPGPPNLMTWLPQHTTACTS